MKIVARLVGEVLPIENPKDKDLKKGLRFTFLAEERIEKTILNIKVEEVIYHQVKTQDRPELNNDDLFILCGDSWELKPENKD